MQFQDDELVSDKASEMLELYSGFVSTCTADCYEHLIPAASFQRQVSGNIINYVSYRLENLGFPVFFCI